MPRSWGVKGMCSMCCHGPCPRYCLPSAHIAVELGNSTASRGGDLSAQVGWIWFLAFNVTLEVAFGCCFSLGSWRQLQRLLHANQRRLIKNPSVWGQLLLPHCCGMPRTGVSVLGSVCSYEAKRGAGQGCSRGGHMVMGHPPAVLTSAVPSSAG